MIQGRIASSVLAVLVASSAIIHLTTHPAQAGSVSVMITPKGDSAKAVSKGLQIYSLFQGFKSRAEVDQRGQNNSAGIAQTGSGNVAGIFQRGNGHTGTITQNGSNNAFGIFQFGRKTSSSVSQTGSGNVGFLFQGGW